MSLTTPSTADVTENIVAQISAEISQTIPLLPKSFTRVMAKAVAGVFVLVYKYAGFSFLQMFVSTASAVETTVLGRALIPLVEWGRLIGVGDPLDGVRAEHTIEIVVENQVGSLAANSQLVHAATGVIHLTTASILLDAATKQVTIRAHSDQQGTGGVGSIGNLEAGDTLSFANPLPNVSGTATVIAQTVTGADAENIDVTYRARVLSRYRQRPQGGAYADYKQWGEEVAGIINVYPYTGDPGEVDVYVEASEASSGSMDGIPTQAQLAAVLASIELDANGLPTRRPANAFVNVYPITREGFDITVTGLDATDIVAARAAIEDAVDEFLRSREPFIVGLSILPRADRITLAGVSGVVDETASSLGATVAAVSMERSAMPVIAYTLADGEKAKLGTAQYL